MELESSTGSYSPVAPQLAPARASIATETHRTASTVRRIEPTCRNTERDLPSRSYRRHRRVLGREGRPLFGVGAAPSRQIPLFSDSGAASPLVAATSKRSWT